MIEILNPGHKLIFVTPFDGRGNANALHVEAIAAYIRGLPEIGIKELAKWTADIVVAL
jgi:hypothetical protein